MPDKGSSPDAPAFANERGGLQSKLDGRYDLIPGEALVRLAKVVGHGAAKYAPGNWRLISYADHINHAFAHLAALIADDTSDDHLGHILCRIAFAVAVEDPAHKFSRTEADAAK